jgi:predicted metal-dependent phosphoesterase TrpH
VHVHSNRSDGTGSVDAIAAAAARAGLRFVVVTDHGDGSRSPSSPRYLSGVLCIDGVEISTDGGHVLALGLGRTPYKLAGDSRGVVEDIARLGGTSVVTHPDSVKADLRWADMDVPFDGIEWHSRACWTAPGCWTCGTA